MIAYNTLERMACLRLEDVEREWKMAALAAQLPRGCRPGLRDHLARGLRALAGHLDAGPAASTERPFSPAS